MLAWASSTLAGGISLIISLVSELYTVTTCRPVASCILTLRCLLCAARLEFISMTARCSISGTRRFSPVCAASGADAGATTCGDCTGIAAGASTPTDGAGGGGGAETG